MGGTGLAGGWHRRRLRGIPQELQKGQALRDWVGGTEVGWRLRGSLRSCSKGQALRGRVGGTETGGTDIGAVAVRMPGGSVRVAIWKRTAVSQPARVEPARVEPAPVNLPVSNLPAQAIAGDSGDGVGCFSLRIIWRD